MESNGVSRRSFLAGAATAAIGLTLRPAFGQSQDLSYLTLKDASELVRSKTVSPVELTATCLKRIETYNPALNAFITVTRDQAMESARAMEEEQRQGKWRGPLHGIPIAIKDNIDTAGVRTTAASELFKDRVPSEDAEVVRRLKNAGAVLLGKTNLHEFALGGTSAVSYFGPVHNPLGTGPDSRRLVGRVRRRYSRRLVLRIVGNRHSGIGSNSCQLLRSCRVQTHVRSREQSRNRAGLLDSRPSWSSVPERRGRGSNARRHRRV
jgi:hypothetical protein